MSQLELDEKDTEETSEKSDSKKVSLHVHKLFLQNLIPEGRKDP